MRNAKRRQIQRLPPGHENCVGQTPSAYLDSTGGQTEMSTVFRGSTKAQDFNQLRGSGESIEPEPESYAPLIGIEPAHKAILILAVRFLLSSVRYHSLFPSRADVQLTKLPERLFTS